MPPTPQLRAFKIALDLDELEYVHNALATYMERMQELSQQSHSADIYREEEGGGLVRTGEVIDVSDMFIAQFVDTKKLRKRFVDLVGRDLTEEGQ